MDIGFGQWLDGYGVANLARDLAAEGQRVTTKAIYQWRNGITDPRPERAMAMSRIAERTGVSMPMERIYAHGELVRSQRTGT